MTEPTKCPRCGANNIPKGKHCGGEKCPLREVKDAG